MKTELNYSEIPSVPTNRRGRPSDPNKLVFLTVGLRREEWDYLDNWEGDNPTQKLENMLRFLRVFAPTGPEVGKPRDEQGRFLPSNGSSKSARQRAARRKQREREASD